MKHFVLATAAALLATPVLAGDLASGDAITTAITGNTVQGSMIESGAYTEFYQADGTIKGADYTGKWYVEADTMCFDYGEGADCWNVKIDGDQVGWVKGGEELGTGTLAAGNPNEF